MEKQTAIITPDEYRVLLAQHYKKGNKYNAKKTGTHASQKEHGRAGELRIKLRAGLISNLREQVKYELIPHHLDEKGNVIERSVSYIADFVYIDNETGQEVVEDTKGYRTQEYIIKRKLMLHIHGIRIKEI